ncbi:MAG: hypothetical protein P8175_14045, partial [Deltaproteobacteria bacterium]
QREKLQGVLEMAGAVCHELNQPMQIVLTCSEILLLSVPKEDPAFRRIQALTEQITRMGEITWKLMRITKYETKEYAGAAKIIDIDRASDDPVAFPTTQDIIASG